ncbi:ABC transporter substrate-binding protein [uncultured Alsobacter sp.]|uniref:ABC transporter substrate-binding protein n=1 Tax=uncultured Alsobacter sp. TaxID=1748258 RepID=UPI0025D847F8|nr:ABC transporter substrate-binding protein [uncultured Alsobacter sp.]
MLMRAMLAGAAMLALACAPAMAQTPLTQVKIGVLSDMSGPLADAYGPGSLHAAELAAADSQKLMPGVKIEVVGANHQNKVDVGSSIARQWYDQEKVDAIFDIVNTAVAIAVQGVAKERKKINWQMTGASSLTGQYCSPWAVHWSTDTHIQTNGVAAGVVAAGGDTWFHITADYSGTREMANQLKALIEKNGGKFLGEALFPMGSTDFASAVVQAQASGAKVIALSSGGLDTVNAIKQLAEFGLVKQGKKIVAPAMFVTDVKALGLEVAQGVTFVDSAYWDLSDDLRAFSKRFEEKIKKPPTPQQINVYTSVMHYLAAVKAAGTTDSDAVMAKVRSLPINYFNTKDGRVRENGSVVKQRYVFEVKSPAESKGPWDLLKVARELTLEQGAPLPVDQSGCKL